VGSRPAAPPRSSARRPAEGGLRREPSARRRPRRARGEQRAAGAPGPRAGGRARG
jgi:hypothetical protein